ncbi:GntR family transcriptional regulator [Alteromonas sp. a30]|uniref:GntR family transcriptional regulator n=1 Tax=Alteromonas sp. a30 TaxID=2730917 RepID=UPI00227EA305|nr:GntR family transcriptional regulator [Alteromonas sp. a30]MCY7293919.1 GntR family transcriptional regulator [Alteromonas sp. a30]
MTRAEELFLALRQQIIEGKIPHGHKISEPELASQFQVSRSTLRDALASLKSIGLLKSQPNVGYSVIQLSSEHLIEVFYVREALEGMACRLAAANITPEQLSRLHSLLESHEHSAQLKAGEAYIQEEKDMDFHFLIVQASHNPMLIDLLCEKLYFLVRMYRYQFGMVSNRAKQALFEHQHIAHALSVGDGELAEILMRRHISSSRANTERNLLNEEGVES